MSIDATYDRENIFAKIIRGEIPNSTVYEDEEVLSFMDVFPQSEGHTLVIAKNVEAVNFLDIPSRDLEGLINRTQHIARAVKEALSPDGIRIMQFNGEAAGQTVFHLHFHIIPIWHDRTLGAHGTEPADAQTLREVAAKIKVCLAKD